MLLKVGELAKRSGLTVRTLHHYDAIGLLRPSARSDSGYRLYNRNDVARLHRIQALRRFGLSLAEVGASLASSEGDLVSIVERQIRMLDESIAQSAMLRDRLTALRGQLIRGEEPELADWLKTLEIMTMMYDKYFSKKEQKSFAMLRTAENSTADEWDELASAVRAAMDAAVPPQSPEAQAFAKRWMEMLLRDSGGDPRLLAKLNDMHLNEPEMQKASGVTVEMVDYIRAAFAETKFALYEKYLSPDEFRFLRENFLKRTNEFPALIAKMYQHMEDGTSPNDPRMRELALYWMELFRSYASDDPQMQAKVCDAYAKEPGLTDGTFVDPRLLAYLNQTMVGMGIGSAANSSDNIAA
ncbi:MAG TPA: MerR family transcriptional regulator [Rhodocyclaceae bacterium]|nr:MerR family transcriptional regulator [Rhodocyclaceae bacterium]